MDLEQEAQALRVLWKSGRDKLRSFFVRLKDVKKETGDAGLDEWCLKELHLTLDTITRFAKILNEVEAETVKSDLAAANKAAAEKRAAEVAAKQKIREEAKRAAELKKEEEKQAAELKKAEHQKKLAEEAEAKAKADASRKKAEATEKRRQDKQKDPNERGPTAAAKRGKRKVTEKMTDAGLTILIDKFKAADKMCVKGDALWIEGSIAKALVLVEMRGRFLADQEFGVWFDKSGIDLSHQDRAALLGLGRLGEVRLREILKNTDRRSYRYIWDDNKKPDLKVVS